ncbi:3-hydroxybutyrate dehydrogenase [Pseudogracilibacillus sp. SO30301A]|uniref:3-hydroxybutyrate dehydrogenase n=1 Tax=Pseudogracilibacillus sp. SO30301A TaxID=3098291 RepID=UPI00300E385C
MLNGNGRVALVTGAASGIGYAIGMELLKNGYRVVFSDLNEQGLAEVTKNLAEKKEYFNIFPCDVTKESKIKNTIDFTVKQFGSLDVVVNNAGMQHVDLVEDFPTETFEQMTQIMMTAPFIMAKHSFPMMKKQKFGRIINMASINGLVGFAGKAAYNSAKHGVIGLTKVLALEGADYGITVNALCPSYVDTPLVRNQLKDLATTRNVSLDSVLEEVIYPLVPQKRLISVKEVADYVLFLASDMAKGVTGHPVVIDGGYTAQ